MAKSLAPFAALILLVGCFKAGTDDDEIGGATEESDSTDESAGTDSESSTTTDTGETTSVDTEDTSSSEDTTDGPMCEPPETACGPVCADLDSDPEHCGACDHSCLGGACVAGACEAVELGSGKGRLFMVQVDADFIYYGGDGVDVGRMKKDGTNDTILKIAGPTNQDREWCYQSAITNTAVVWGNDWVQPGVRGCVTPDCAGGVQTFVPGLNIFAMTYSKANDTLYWNQGPDINQRTWPGGMPSVFVAGAGSPRSLAADASFVYWSSQSGGNLYRVLKAPVGGGAPIEIVPLRPSIGDIEVGPDNVYWVEGPEILFAPLPGGGLGTSFGSASQAVRFMAIDATHLYWTVTGDAGSVQRCPLAGCAGIPETLATSQNPWGITLDPAAVYWVTEAGGIHKIAK